MSGSSPRRQYTYEYPRPAVTVDVALVTREVPPRVLLIQRKHHPFAGCWALPGGFVEESETLEAAARRELQEETTLTVSDLEQLHTFGTPGRDPRGWTISVVYWGRVDAATLAPRAEDDAAQVGWFGWDELPPLAFDHAEILERVRIRWLDRRA